MNPDPPRGDSNPQQPWIERLAQEARILGEARMLRDDEPITDEKRALIFQKLTDYLKRTGKSQEWAAKSMGIKSASVLSQVVTGNYAADTEKFVRIIDKWIESQILREQAPRPPGFVSIGIVEKCYAVARWMMNINGIGLIHGPAGIGKTKILQAIHADTPGSGYISITTAGMGKLAVLSKLAVALRIPGVRGTTYEIEDQLVKELTDKNRLIIVDEIHKLEGRRKDESLHVLRDLHTATKSPMLWAGMSNIADYIQRGRTKWEPLDQLNSRIKFWLDLRELAASWDGSGGGLYSVDDIRKIIAKMKIRVTPDAIRYLQMIANEPGMGHLRTVCENLLLYALKKTSKKGVQESDITAQMLRDIRRDSNGERAAEVFERQLELRVAASA